MTRPLSELFCGEKMPSLFTVRLSAKRLFTATPFANAAPAQYATLFVTMHSTSHARSEFPASIAPPRPYELPDAMPLSPPAVWPPVSVKPWKEIEQELPALIQRTAFVEQPCHPSGASGSASPVIIVCSAPPVPITR